MILFLGLLSLLQITFLPGAVAMRLFKPKGLGGIERLVFSFAFSLIINFVIVFLLTALGLYQRGVVLLLFIAELAAFIWLYRQLWTTSLEELAAKSHEAMRDALSFLSSAGKRTEERWQTLLRLVLYIVLGLGAISSLIWITNVLIANRLTVFSVWDSVVSWNPWAVGWANNHIPDLTRRYGQLVPANWSLSYVFMGTTQIQFFAKSIMPLFTLSILVLMVHAGVRFKSYGYFAAAILTQLMFKKFLGEHVSSGYVDTAVSFFSFASLYCLIRASTSSNKSSTETFLAIGAVLAGGAFCAKQPGLYVLLAYPVIAYFAVIRPDPKFTRGELVRSLGYPLALALLISVPWYLFTEISIWFGTNKTEFAWILEEVHRGRTLWERFVLALGSLDKYIALFLVAILSYPFQKKPLRWITVLIILPYTVFWALYASYSHRNLAIVFPLLAVVGGLGIEHLVEFFQSILAKVRFGRFPILATSALVLILGLFGALSVEDSKFIDLQTTLQKDILIRGLNRDLYEYFETTEDYGLILSGYPLEHLPGFEGMSVRDSYEEYATYIRHRSEYPEIKYLLMPPTTDDAIYEEVMQQVETGTYELIFEQNRYIFIRVSPPNP